MDCNTPGFPVLHHVPQFAQTYVHWVGDAIQPSHPLSSPSPPALNLSQHPGFFPMSQPFTSGGQSVGASASAVPMNIQGWFPLGLTLLISLLSKGFPRAFSSTTVLQHSAFFFMVQLSLPYMTTGKTIALTGQTFVGKAMSLLFNMLSRFVIAFLPRSKCLLISWLQSRSVAILEPKEMKSVTVSIFFTHLFAMKWWDRMPWSLFFECWVLSQLFHSPLSLPLWDSLVPLCFLP